MPPRNVASTSIRLGVPIPVTVRFRGVSRPASDNYWTPRPRSRGGGAATTMPHVMFSLDLLPKRSARRKLANMLARSLAEKFGAVYVLPRTIVPLALLKFDVNGVEFVVMVLSQQPRKGEWHVAIYPLEALPPVVSSPSEEQKKYAGDLRLISEEVHVALSAIPGVTRLRWFFEGRGHKKLAVRTPAELPWQGDASESRDAHGTSAQGSISSSTPRSSTSGRLMAFLQRHPFLLRLCGRTSALIIGLLGPVMLAIGIPLLLRSLGELSHGERTAGIWLTCAIAVSCSVVGVLSFSLLMPYRVRRASKPAVPGS